MDNDERHGPGPGLHPVAGVAMVVGLVALALGVGLVLRQAGAHPPGSRVAAQTSSTQAVAATPGSTAAPVPTSTIALPVAVPAATRTPPPEAGARVPTAAPVGRAVTPRQVEPPRALEQTPQPLVVGTGQAPPRPTSAAATPPASASAAEAPDSAPPAPEAGADQPSTPGETYTGLPVAVPATAVLDGAELPVGPAGVRSDGARAFARTLVGRARAQNTGLVEDPALRQVAERALVDELTRSTPTGRGVPTRRRQGSVTVQIDIVATLPATTGAWLPMFSSTNVPAIGVAVGVAGRVEPDYLPDLVAVAAVAYR